MVNPLRSIIGTARKNAFRAWDATPAAARRVLLARLAARFRACLADTEGPTICFLPTSPWFGGLFQRYQQMARAFAENGCAVVYAVGSVSGALIGKTQREPGRFGFTKVAPRLHVLHCPRFLVRDLLDVVTPDLLLANWPDQASAFGTGCQSFLNYEMLDDHSLIPEAGEAFHRAHDMLLKTADLVSVTADDLMRQVSGARPDAFLVPNGVRLEDWLLPQTPEIPADMAAARKAPVVIGYYGAIATWFDWDLLANAARQRPHWAFVLIGLPYDDRGREIVALARDIPNIHFLGTKPYAELSKYLAHFDVATIPFLLNDVTHACSPVKLFEFMAAGKPIVCTAMREVLKYRSVIVAESADHWVEKLETAMEMRQKTEYQAVLREEAEANTWRSRARRVTDELERARRRTANIPRRQSGG